ncbi:MAG: hypothetical protein ACM32J_13205 [Rhizobacter sp.]|jgi:outer membrane lipoprotein SlyB
MNKSILMISALTAGCLGLAGCDVNKTQEGDVTVPKYEKTQEGNVTMPKYEVTPPDVKVETKEKTITVPDIDVTPAKDK